MSPEEVRLFLDSHSRGVGVASRSHDIRWRNREQLFVKDTGMIPSSATFKRRLACCEAHPGVCATADANYDDILTLAVSLERFAGAAWVNCFLQWICSTPDEVVATHITHFCLKRRRSPFCQVTHVFLPLDEVGQEYVLRQRHAFSKTYNFLTVWHLAKLLLQGNPTSIAGRLMSHRDGINGGVVFPGPAQVQAFTEVWPFVYRPPARPRPATEAIDRLDARGKPRRTAKGKIYYVGPAKAKRIQLFAEDELLGSSDADEDSDVPPDFGGDRDVEDEPAGSGADGDSGGGGPDVAAVPLEPEPLGLGLDAHRDDREAPAPEAPAPEPPEAPAPVPAEAPAPEPPEAPAPEPPEAPAPELPEAPAPEPPAGLPRRPRRPQFPRLQHSIHPESGKTSFIRLSQTAGREWKEMRAYCATHEDCYISRSCRVARPLGVLWAWLDAHSRPDCGSARLHKDFVPDYDDRCRARTIAEGHPDAAEWVQAEAGEPGDPEPL